MTSFDYVVVQAGGKGTRLETLTANKPKALVPVDNLPMIFHLFKKYPGAKFKIIVDYKRDVFKRYLKAFANVDYEIIDADRKGTCAGIRKSLSLIPDNTSFMLIWCDLVLSGMQPGGVFDYSLNYLGISRDFPCRWSYYNNEFAETPSTENGVAGMFIFKNKAQIEDVPEEGEFVRYLSTKNLSFERLNMFGGLEIGTMLSYFQNELNKPKCRPFNKMEFKGDIVLKYPLNEQGKKLADDEIAWYKKVTELGYNDIPKIYGYDPYVSVDSAWHLSRKITHVLNVEDIYKNCDFITIHVPLLDSTRHMIGKKAISMMKKGVILINMARDQLVDEEAVVSAIEAGRVRRYVSDFPNSTVAGRKGCITTPHLGASTEESEINCAKMAVDELKDYLENGNPELHHPPAPKFQ